MKDEDSLEYTENMEKAMHQNHGIGHEEYSQSLEKKIEVEKAREIEYKKSLQPDQELKRRFDRS